MTVKKQLRSISLNKSHIDCHNEARKAYTLSKGLKYQIRQQSLISNLGSLYGTIEPLHVTQSSANHFHFFAGWDWFDLFSIDGEKRVDVIVHTDISKEQITKLSWLYVLKGLLADLHRKSNLSQLVTAIDKMPTHIKQFLFKEDYSYSTHIIVQRITGETRSAIRHQIETNSPKPIQKRSIFDELVEDD